MTFYANRDHIEPMFRGIAFVMMVLFCLCRAVMARQRIRPGQLAFSDGLLHDIFCLNSFGMTNFILFYSSGLGFSAFIALGVTFSRSLTLFALVIAFFCGLAIFAFVVAFYFGLAFFALKITFLPSPALFALSITSFTSFIFFCLSRFGLIANSTSLGYDLLSHNRFFYKRLRLGPIARHSCGRLDLLYKSRGVNQD